MSTKKNKKPKKDDCNLNNPENWAVTIDDSIYANISPERRKELHELVIHDKI